jgi:hypothetical protein
MLMQMDCFIKSGINKQKQVYEHQQEKIIPVYCLLRHNQLIALHIPETNINLKRLIRAYFIFKDLLFYFWTFKKQQRKITFFPGQE